MRCHAGIGVAPPAVCLSADQPEKESYVMTEVTNSVLLDEERRLASHQEVKASIDKEGNLC